MKEIEEDIKRLTEIMVIINKLHPEEEVEDGALLKQKPNKTSQKL